MYNFSIQTCHSSLKNYLFACLFIYLTCGALPACCAPLTWLVLQRHWMPGTESQTVINCPWVLWIKQPGCSARGQVLSTSEPPLQLLKQSLSETGNCFKTHGWDIKLNGLTFLLFLLEVYSSPAAEVYGSLFLHPLQFGIMWVPWNKNSYRKYWVNQELSRRKKVYLERGQKWSGDQGFPSMSITHCKSHELKDTCSKYWEILKQ